VPRWELGSEERLKQAALELFDEQGFQDTTAVQIAKRAGVTTRTFFRYFPDKQATLFADAERLSAGLVQGILDATDVAEPLRTVVRVLAGFDWLGVGSRESQRRRDAMIASNPGLLERELIKQQQMANGFSSALRQRGVAADTAELAARVGIEVFRAAYRRWLTADDETDLSGIADDVMSTLATIVRASHPSRIDTSTSSPNGTDK
jgi:AcrR family transcriptional regulator